MRDYLLIQRRLEINGTKSRVKEVRVSFVRLPSDDWSAMAHLSWSKWVAVDVNLEGAKTREMIEVSPKTLLSVLDSQLDLVRLMEEEDESFPIVIRRANRSRRRARAS